MNFLKLSQMRITPAWAGKRAVDTVNRYEHWDHPRVGGEKHSWLSVGTVV